MHRIYGSARSGENMSKIVVCAMYKFVTLENYEMLREPLHNAMLANELSGTLLLASEGINGTVAGTKEGVDALLAWLATDPRLSAIVTKESFDTSNPFLRTKVKLKKEIVTMGVQGIDPKQVVGTYVKPKDWNALISDPNVLLVDTRNDYEVKVGTFEGALDPKTTNFREFPQYVKDHLDPEKNKKVAMFCTGGIRCEKSTAYLKEQGFEQVYHLEGGILKYLEEVPQQESMWQGECFVFDNRVTVDHSLNKGKYDQCHACRLPLSAEQMQHQHYEKGVSCEFCFDTQTSAQRERFAQRELQMQLAQRRGDVHLGGDALATMNKRRELKQQLRDAQKPEKKA